MFVKSIKSTAWILRSFARREILFPLNARCLYNVRQILPKTPVHFTPSVHCFGPSRFYSHHGRPEITGPLNTQNFEEISDDTLDSLSEYFEEIMEKCPLLKDYDVNYGDGVLTVKFGKPYGTYVINRQTPNQQIWLSSPTSGPKRYDFEHGQWIYRHDGVTLHQLLDLEIGNIVKHDVEFSKCSYSGTQ